MSSFATSSERIEIDLSDQLKDTNLNDDDSVEENISKNSLEEEFSEKIPLPSASRSSPVVVLVIGMAGAGKSSLMHRINLYANEKGIKGYYVNLDPAVTSVPFGVNIDIRDTINYKEVMSQYGLGPNGAILTSLNLFATRFDQVYIIYY
jgi:GTPase SAR1 family protein